MKSPTELAEHLCRQYEQMQTTLETWKTHWQELAEHVMPRKATITQKVIGPDESAETLLFETTAVRSNLILANGQLAGMTPADSRWFSYDAPEHLRGNDAVEQWFRRCTEIAQAELARSNFYSEAHEFYLDRGAFGTAAIYVQEGRKNALNFSTFEIGSYAIAEDDEGYVDTFYRCLPMTLRQAEKRFGRKALSVETQKKLDAADKGGKKNTEEIEILHAIYPRDASDYDPGMGDAENMPVASVYLERKAKHTIKVGGYAEQPAFASRYLKWGGQIYGWSPSWAALPEARQLNFLEKDLDALAEVSAFPRILIPDTHEGEIDLRASGYTVFDPNNAAAKPQEWLTAGRYDIGLDRANRKAKAIEQAFHVDFFQMFAQLDKQMTAREVAERAAEKLNQFASTFARMTTEIYNPLLQRVWGILVRGGKFPPPPEEVLIEDESGVYLPEPQVSYSSRIALAIKALENNAFINHVEQMIPIWQLRPELLDNYEWDTVERDMARNIGVTARWLKAKQDVDAIRQQRAEQQARMMEMQEQAMAADAAGKVANIKEDSVVARTLPKAA